MLGWYRRRRSNEDEIERPRKVRHAASMPAIALGTSKCDAGLRSAGSSAASPITSGTTSVVAGRTTESSADSLRKLVGGVELEKQPKLEDQVFKQSRWNWAWRSRGLDDGQSAESSIPDSNISNKNIARDECSNNQLCKNSRIVPDFESLERQPSLIHRLWYTSRGLRRSTPHHVHKIVIIGVHGYFPARMTRKILGEPTGTSIRFANEAAMAVETWCAEQNLTNVTVEKIALEGEGKIDHRVKTLYDLLLNWSQLLSEADFIIFAVHSQGTVVATRILERLLCEEVISKAQKTAILGMAGTCLGPMPGMDSTLFGRAITRIEHDSLFELFQLQNIASEQSQKFLKAMSCILKSGTRLILIGSADDQLVPLYSALCMHVSHPNIFRAVYFDEDMESDFVASLVDLALRQCNSGKPDHSVITELSRPLSGALTGKGHSKLYSSNSLYRLAMSISLETQGVRNVDLKINHDFKLPDKNPYVLPWAVHALVSHSKDEAFIRELYDNFRRWKPKSKTMKDLKFRLAAMHDQPKL